MFKYVFKIKSKITITILFSLIIIYYLFKTQQSFKLPELRFYAISKQAELFL